MQPQTDTINKAGPIEVCPGCDGQDFVVEEVEETVVFKCLGCDSLWRYELGYIWAVNHLQL